MRSEEEILESLRQTFQEGIREGSIHTNPPPPNYLKNLLDEEHDESQQNPQLSEEQLRNLLSDFLDQLIASKPPAKDSEDYE